MSQMRVIPRHRRWLYTLFVMAVIAAMADALVGLYLQLARRATAPMTRMLSAMNNLEPHPEYIWTYRAGSRVRMDGQGQRVDVEINQDGLRDGPIRPERYFLAVGDSFTFGWLVPLEATWHRQLAAHLSQDVPITSVNLGMWMSTFSQHYLRLREMLERYPRPEFVMHLVYPSHVQTIASHIFDFDSTGDIRRTRSLLLHIRDGEMYYGRDPESLIPRHPTWPYTVWAVRRYLAVSRFAKTYATTVDRLEAVNDLLLYAEKGGDVFEPAWDKTRQAISATAVLLRTRRVPYLVAIIPRDRQVSGGGGNAMAVPGRHPQERFLAMCRQLDIACLDLLPDLRRAAETEAVYFSKDPHWTSAGHHAAARALTGFVRGALGGRSVPQGDGMGSAQSQGYQRVGT